MLEAGPDPKSAEAVYLKLAQGYPESEEGIAAQWRLGWLSWLRSDYTEAAERWARITTIRVASQNYRDAALYWTARAHTAAGQAESASKYFAQLISESPRSYYGVLALRRVPRLPESRSQSRRRVAGRVAACRSSRIPPGRRAVRAHRGPPCRGADDFADEEMDELVRRSSPTRAYMRWPPFMPRIRATTAENHAPPLRPGAERAARARTFWEAFYPIGWRSELTSGGPGGRRSHLVAAVVREESSYNAQARSRCGRVAHAALMPDTAAHAPRGLPFNDGALLDEPFANLTLGSAPAGPRRVRDPASPWPPQRGRHLGAPVVEGTHHGRSEVFVELIPFTETRGCPTRHAAWDKYRRLAEPRAPDRERCGHRRLLAPLRRSSSTAWSGRGVGLLLHVAGDRALPREPPATPRPPADPS
jgi:soluble lytic murein transglycosylase-like protein